VAQVACAHQFVHNLAALAVVHGLQLLQGLGIGQQQQRALTQAQGADTGHEFLAGFVGFEQQHGAGRLEGKPPLECLRMTP
jgi:hypothetical protein